MALWLFLLVVCTPIPIRGIPACTQEDQVCEFTLVAEVKLTMMAYKTLTYPSNGELFKYTVTNTSEATPVPVDDVITADGWQNSRMVYVFNNSFPGPAIEVWENQMIKVHVKNMLRNEGITVHWHGLHQRGTPFMDGVAFVSQCPILPRQTFTYIFKAYPKGTFWYHSHLGSQRTMGLYGPIIIHEREASQPRLPEMTWTITDWNHDYDSELGYYKMVYGIYEGRSKLKGTGSLDGSFFSLFRYHSGLLNGRGRYYDPKTGQHNGAPLSSFTVKPEESYRVRMISAGELYPFRVSVDQHPLTLIASDGYYLEPVTVQSIIINPGERFDFIINASKPVNNYWIRGETLEVGVNHTFEAILRYEGAPTNMDPTTKSRTCSLDEECVVANCPFAFYPKADNTECISFDELRSKTRQDTPTGDKAMFEEQFLNFAFPGETSTPGSINGRVYEQPVVSAFSQPHEIHTHCSDEQCGEGKLCKCTWALPLKHAKTYQFIFLNMGKGKGWSHPIHMHGHSFYVLKMGYGRYNKTSGKLIGDNLDINCRGNSDRDKSYCNDATWSNPSWKNGNVPGLELDRPPRKDTLIVPTGGYSVVRIRADNPGVWIVHCHIQIHNLDGMAMLLNESYPNHPEIPTNFPSCKSFLQYETNSPTTSKTATPTEETSTAQPMTTETFSGDNPIEHGHDVYRKELFWGVVGCLVSFIVIVLGILVIYMCIHRPSVYRSKSYSLDPIHSRHYKGPNLDIQPQGAHRLID